MTDGTTTTDGRGAGDGGCKDLRYYSFKDYLTEEEAAQFFTWSHAVQVDKVRSYLDFLAAQPRPPNFTSSSKASISYAMVDQSRLDGDAHERVDSQVLRTLTDGKTMSGFGAFGTDDGFLPQKELSMAVANVIEHIGHQYMVERNKKGEMRPPVLNSRSFFFYWCHAEKQKIMDIQQKLDDAGVSTNDRTKYWAAVVVHVDRDMCADCIEFATKYVIAERICMRVQDPSVLRVFGANGLTNKEDALEQ
ncbi:TPA: hypothetical protein N0F65_010050 [Lagenidium giganteum]|uniref:Single-strand DNA deaminase toxin A-like C-terminal domain-containing protein n=1 Tax=Lagenidium giganteum TaxID=4803 RepID=A0AAV2ZHY2_9STRA|nr:TPA: hypothetical protein N0F65_010050 [Lagenidium giganteum]